jgi:hypothetical protein
MNSFAVISQIIIIIHFFFRSLDADVRPDNVLDNNEVKKRSVLVLLFSHFGDCAISRQIDSDLDQVTDPRFRPNSAARPVRHDLRVL